MPSISYSINSSGAEAGAAKFAASIDKIIADATRGAKAMESFDKAVKGMASTAGGSGAALAKLTAPLKQIQDASPRAAAGVSGLTSTMRALSSSSALAFGPLSGLGSRFTAIGSLATQSSLALGGFLAVATGVGVGLGMAVKSAADFQEGMVRVAKVTNASTAELQLQSSGLLKLSSALGVSATELAGITQTAAQLGIRGTADLQKFTEQIAMITRTTNLTADAAANGFGRLIQLTKEPTSNIAGMTAALTALGNNSKATEDKILGMTEWLARSTVAFGVSSEKLLALGGALADVGARSQSAGTAVSQVMIGITQAAAGGKNLKGFSDLLGVTADQFKALSKQDIGAVFLKVLQALSQQGPAAVNVLQQLHLGSQRNFQVLLSLAGVMDTVGRDLNMVAKEYANPTAAAREFETMSLSLNRQMEIAGTQFQNLGILLGNIFVPSLVEAMKSVNEFLGLLQGIAPETGKASEGVKQFAQTVTGNINEAIVVMRVLQSTAALVLDTFDPFQHIPFFSGPADSARRLTESMGPLHTAVANVSGDFKALEAGGAVDLFPNGDKNAKDAIAVADAANVLKDKVTDASHAPRTLAEALDALAVSGQRVNSVMTETSSKVTDAIKKLDDQIKAKQLELTQGKGVADGQAIINKLEEAHTHVSDTDAAAIIKRTKTLDGLNTTTKAVAKETKDAAKAEKDFGEGIDKAFKDVQDKTKLEGLTEDQKNVQELTDKLEEMRVKAVNTGEDAAKAQETFNEALAKGIPLAHQLSEAQANKAKGDALRDLEQQVQVGQILIDQGKAAADTQQTINGLKNQGIQTDDVYVQKILEQNKLLHDQETSVVHLGDVFKDSFNQAFDAVIEGTRSFGDVLEGIGLGIGKRLFTAMLDSKLKDFDPTVKANFLDLGDFGTNIFGQVFNGASDLIGNLINAVSGGGGGGFVGPLLENGAQSAGFTGPLFGNGGTGGIGGVGAHSFLGGASSILLNGIINSGGFFANSNPAASLGLSALSGISSGLSISGTSGGLIGALFGSSMATTTLGDIIPTGIQSVLGGLVGEENLASILGPTLGTVGAVAGGVVGGAGGLYSAYQLGQGGQSAGQAAASAASVAAGAAAVYVGLSALNFFPVIGTIIYAVLAALTFIVSMLTKFTPTDGSVLRKQSESILDSFKTFQDLQKSLGDITEGMGNTKKGTPAGIVDNYVNGSATAASRGFTPEAQDAVSAFAGIFAQKYLSNTTGLSGNGNPVLLEASQQSNVLAEFFSRAKIDAKDFATFTTTELLKAFTEAGITLEGALKMINGLSETFNKVSAMGNDISQATGKGNTFGVNVAQDIRGVGAIFESDTKAIPPGVHIAALAVEELEKDGVKAFNKLDGASSDFFVKLANDAKSYDEVVNQLLQQGFEINTDELKARLQDIIASAQEVGASFSGLFSAPTFEQGIQGMVDHLKQTLQTSLSNGFMEQLFGKTNFAGIFEPVFAALDKMKDFDLTKSSGVSDFMATLLPAITQGKANLDSYLPILKQMYEAAKEFNKQLDQALAPSKAEVMADAMTQAFSGLGSVFADAIKAGTAVIAAGGTWEQGLTAFNAVMGPGITKTFKTAMFNALLDTAIIAPFIAKWTPAIQYVVAMGTAVGFGDPRVQAAWHKTLTDMGAEAESFGPLLLGVGQDLFGDAASQAQVFFTKMKQDVTSINQSLGSGLANLLKESIDEGYKNGAEAGKSHFDKGLGQVIYDVVFNALITAFVDALMAQSTLGPLIEQGAALYAAATSGKGPGGSAITPAEQAGIDAWKTGFRAAYSEFATNMRGLADYLFGPNGVLDLPGPDGTSTSGKKTVHGDGHGDITTGGGDSSSPSSPDFIGRQARNSRGGYDTSFDPSGRGGADVVGRQTIDQNSDAVTQQKTATEKLTDATSTQTDATKSLTDAIDALAAAIHPADTTGGDTGGGTAPPGGGRHLPPSTSDVAAASSFHGDTASTQSFNFDPTTRGGGGPRQYTNPGGIHTRTGGGGSGWGPGGPNIGANDPRNPANDDHTANAPDDGTASKISVSFDFSSAMTDFFSGGTASDLHDAIQKSVGEGMIAGMKQGLMLKLGLDAFEKQVADAIQHGASASDLAAMGQKFAAKAEAGITAAKPAFDAVAAAFGLDIAGGVSTNLKSSLGTAFTNFATSGDLNALHTAVRDSINKATQDGIINGMLAEGPVHDAIDGASKQMSDALRDAQKDGKITPEEAQHLKDLGTTLGDNLNTALAALDPAIAAMFDSMRDRAAEAMKQAGDLIGGTLKGLFNDPKNLNYAAFSTALRQQVFQSVAGGLVDAFIQAAVIQGAMAPMLAAIALIFEQISKHQLSIVDANIAIGEQVKLIVDVLKDPAFKAAIDTMLDGLKDIGKTLGAFPAAADAATSAATGVSDAVNQANSDVCTGQCDLTQKTNDLGKTVLDASGRMGDMQDLVWEQTHNAVGDGGSNVKRKMNHTLHGGDGPAGFTGSDADFRHAQRWEHRLKKDRNAGGADWQPGYYGPLASGGITPDDGYAYLHKNEAVIPLDQLEGGSGGHLDQEILDALHDLRKSLDDQPIIVNLEAKVDQAKVIDLMWKAKRAARDSGVSL